MFEKYVSEQLINKLPNSLINFIWYLWEAYCDPKDKVSLFILESGNKCQIITIHSLGKTIEQDFGISANVKIQIRKEGLNYYMSD